MATSPIFPLFVFAFGAIFGSFINVVVLRSIKGASLFGRSACPHCGRTLTWQELVPIFSFIFQRGRCHTCGESIAIQYPLVEFVAGLAAIALFPNIPAIAFFLVLLTLFMIDMRTFLLPDFFIVLLSVLAILFGQGSYEGMLLGGGFLLFLWAITSGQGIGFGDVKLLIPLGLWFGIPGTVTLLAIAFVVGALMGSYLLITKQATRKTAIAFGPYLAGAAMLLLIFPQIILTVWSIFVPGAVFG